MFAGPEEAGEKELCMTLRERTISALEAQDKSDLDNLISRCYYEGAVDGATNTCDVYSAKIAEMQKTAEGMRYHNVANLLSTTI